jgi:hypothetical protein
MGQGNCVRSVKIDGRIIKFAITKNNEFDESCINRKRKLVSLIEFLIEMLQMVRGFGHSTKLKKFIQNIQNY